MSQCHPIEGAMTLYFRETIPHSSTVTSAITLQTLNAIKEAMENGSLLSSLNSYVLSLTFLDSSYSLSSASSQLDAAEVDDTSGNSSSKSNSGLIAGLTMVFLALGILMFILFFVVCKNYKNDDRMERRDMVGIEVSVDTNLEDTTTREEDNKDLSSATNSNYHSECNTDTFYGSRGSNYSEFSSDSEAHDSVYMSEGESPGYSNNIFYKTNQAGAAYGHGVIADGTEDNGFVMRPVS